MSKVQVQEFVEPVSYDLTQKLGDFVFQIRKAVADGWQPGQDLPVVLTAVMKDLIPVVQGLEQALAESKDDEEAFVTSLLLGSKHLYYGLKKPVVKL
jgi:hypothetical protein